MYFILPILIGAATVFQGMMNKRISTDSGLGWAVTMNNFFVLLICVGLVAFKALPSQPSLQNFKWWHLWPGVFGTLIVVGIPFSMQKIGSSLTFLLIIAAQLCIAGLSDYFIDGLSLTWTRIVGMSLALFGAWLAVR